MMATETKPWDAAEFITSAEHVRAYIETYLEDGTPEELRRALDTVARSKGISELARETGMTRAGIYKALGENGNPSFETIRQIMAAMGMRLSVVPIGKEVA
jgi:probable addiction module antidote protein